VIVKNLQKGKAEVKNQTTGTNKLPKSIEGQISKRNSLKGLRSDSMIGTEQTITREAYLVYSSQKNEVASKILINANSELRSSCYENLLAYVEDPQLNIIAFSVTIKCPLLPQ